MTSSPKKVSLPMVDPGDPSADPDAQTCGVKGMACQGCELQDKKRVVGEGYTGHVDIMIISESPSSWSVNNNSLFYGRGGRIIRQTWKKLAELDAASGGNLNMRYMKRWETYAVQCQVEGEGEQSATASASVINRCSVYLRSAIRNRRPKVILALGTTALKAVGYHGDRFQEARGRLLDMNVAGHQTQVIPTFSTKALINKSGLYGLFINDFTRALRIASGKEKELANVTVEELTKTYIIPTTVAEVVAVCDTAINYVITGATSAAQCSLAVDTETNTLHPHRPDAKVICVSFSWDTGKSTAIPLFHKDASWTPQELEVVVANVKRVLECAKPKIFHNYKFDSKFLELRHGFHVTNVAWDTMLGEHLLNEDMAGSYSLKTLGRSYFPQFANYADKVHELAEKLTDDEVGVEAAVKLAKKGKIKKKAPGFDPDMVAEMGRTDLHKYLVGTKKDRKKRVMDSGYERVPLDVLLPYAAIDTDLTRRLLRSQTARAREEGYNARPLMASHCIPASRVLGQMEFEGVRVDREYLVKLEENLKGVVDKCEGNMQYFWNQNAKFRAVREPFNPNATRHLCDMLYSSGIYNPTTGKQDVRGEGVVRNVKSGQLKTDKKTLRGIADRTDCPFTKSLLQYRAAHKALTGFVREIDALSVADGRIHPNFHIHGTGTGRLASSNINMQNISKTTALCNIKKLFVPDADDELFFNIDAKGAEIRVFTAYAHDAELIKALDAGLDVHSFFTQELFGIPYDEVETGRKTDKKMSALRDNVKRVVFGLLYGAMAKKIAETAQISIEEAEVIIQKLYTRFPSLPGYIDETVKFIRDNGFVETFFGRRRRFPLFSVNGFFRGQAERRGKNMKIQSTSSDIVIGQLVEINQHIGELGGKLRMTVHDSIAGSVKKRYVHQLKDFFENWCAKRIAERYPWMRVGFPWDVEVGPSYGETMALEDYLKNVAPPEKPERQIFLEEIDEEINNELRETEEDTQIREREEAVEITRLGQR